MTLVHTYPFDNKISCRKNQWRLLEGSAREVAYLTQRHNLPEVVARLLAQRKVTAETADLFLKPTLKNLMPDPFHLKDMDMAVKRTLLALEHKEKIVIFGDYDVDGATASATLKRYFDAIGADASIYIPDRLAEGYGLNQQALEYLKAQGNTLVITVDCGTTSFESLEWARDNELDVIILDHHMSEEELPPATALVNPNRQDETSEYTYVCAAGLAFLFIAALQQKLRDTTPESKLPDLRSYLDLVALGTICDMVPLKGLNRAYVTQGLKVLRKGTNVGLKALMDVSNVQEKPNTYHLGFLLGPRINAGGRIGQADLGAQLLSTDDPALAQTIAAELNDLNQERRAMEATITEEAFTQIKEKNLHKDSVICVASTEWHVGIVGIVSGRIKEHYNKPCFVIAIDEHSIGKGSGRSVPGFDLGALAHAARHEGLLINGGGHAMAAGITIESDKIDAFKDFLVENIPAEDETSFLDIHGSVTVSGASVDLIESIDQLSPFGPSNPTPNFMLTNMRVTYADVVGQNHVRCTLESEDKKRLSAIAFQAEETEVGKWLLANQKKAACHVVGTLQANHWQGRTTAQLVIKDVMGV